MRSSTSRRGGVVFQVAGAHTLILEHKSVDIAYGRRCNLLVSAHLLCSGLWRSIALVREIIVCGIFRAEPEAKYVKCVRAHVL